MLRWPSPARSSSRPEPRPRTSIGRPGTYDLPGCRACADRMCARMTPLCRRRRTDMAEGPARSLVEFLVERHHVEEFLGACVSSELAPFNEFLLPLERPRPLSLLATLRACGVHNPQIVILGRAFGSRFLGRRAHGVSLAMRA